MTIGPLPEVSFFAGVVTDRPLAGGDLLRCRVCHLKFRWPLLPDYPSLYDNSQVDSWSASPLRHDQLIVRQALEVFQDDCRLLDFGCYTGGFMAQLAPRFDRFGVEVSNRAAQVARERTGAHVVAALDEFPPDLRFDAIVSMDVVEHVRSPRALLQHLYQRLRPGGRLVITTGDGSNLLWRLVGSRWWYCYFPEHIAFISPGWLRFHMPGIGFSIDSIRRFNYLQESRATAQGWSAWLKYLLRPERHAAKRAAHLARHGTDMGVPGIGLARDHLVIELLRSTPGNRNSARARRMQTH